MPLLSFTDAQIRAWDWVRAAIEDELSASEALSIYRSEGGKIRTQDWYRLYSSLNEFSSTWDTINQFSNNETIPERFWMPAPRAFENTYVAEVKLTIRNTETNELQTTYRYIESDHRMSQDEIENYIVEMGKDYPAGETWSPEFIYGYKFYKKGT
jgi:hypothetical protein